jgi:hypothetical protein
LPWALSRAAQGVRCLPDGLSRPRDDGTAPVGDFDAVCAAPGLTSPINPVAWQRLMSEAVSSYDHVVVETGWLVGATSGRERFNTVRDVLSSADDVFVVASSDPEGAARLVEWRAAADTVGPHVPVVAAFGRAPDSRYEREHLARIIRDNTGQKPFADVIYLPEDPVVARARWNAELVWRGPWLQAVREAVAHALHRPRQLSEPGDSGARRPLPRSRAGAARAGSLVP